MCVCMFVCVVTSYSQALCPNLVIMPVLVRAMVSDGVAATAFWSGQLILGCLVVHANSLIGYPAILNPRVFGPSRPDQTHTLNYGQGWSSSETDSGSVWTK